MDLGCRLLTTVQTRSVSLSKPQKLHPPPPHSTLLFLMWRPSVWPLWFAPSDLQDHAGLLELWPEVAADVQVLSPASGDRTRQQGRMSATDSPTFDPSVTMYASRTSWSEERRGFAAANDLNKEGTLQPSLKSKTGFLFFYLFLFWSFCCAGASAVQQLPFTLQEAVFSLLFWVC